MPARRPHGLRPYCAARCRCRRRSPSRWNIVCLYRKPYKPNDAIMTNLAKVFLVGAGPGDPDLLTLKAVKTIARADVILVDDLVNPAILEHAKAGARIVHVGKRGGCQSTPQ